MPPVRLPFLVLTAIGVFLAGLLPNPAQALEWIMDREASKLDFVVKAQDNTIRGFFRTFRAQIRFDPDDPEGGLIDITIDIGSISTGADQGNTLALSADWLHASMFPMARFQSTTIKELGPGRYRAVGSLEIKKQSLPVELTFSLALDGSTALATGSTVFARAEYGIGGPNSDNLPIADDILIEFSIFATSR